MFINHTSYMKGSKILTYTTKAALPQKNSKKNSTVQNITHILNRLNLSMIIQSQSASTQKTKNKKQEEEEEEEGCRHDQAAIGSKFDAKYNPKS